MLHRSYNNLSKGDYHMKIEKIISGGQTGADQAALDFAIENSIPHGGWIPKGRLTESGPLASKYNLQEMPSASYARRTEKNIREASGTLIVTHGRLTGGSALTWKLAKQHGKPCLHLDLEGYSPAVAARILKSWLQESRVRTLNVAGPRASKDCLIYKKVKGVLAAMLELPA